MENPLSKEERLQVFREVPFSIVVFTNDFVLCFYLSTKGTEHRENFTPFFH